jgi:hypothetical protein
MALICTGLAFSSAQAHEVGILLDKQFGSAQAIAGLTADAARPTGAGLRGAYTLLNLGVAEVGVSGTYHFEAKDDLTVNGYHLGNFSNQYWAIGAQADWKLLLNLHAGLELRREKADSDGGLLLGDASTTFTRPWISAGVGFSFPLPVVSPFVRLEAAYALQTYSVSENSSFDDVRKAMAPKFQIALYGGIRF